MENKLCRICWNTNDWKRPTGIASTLENGSFASQFGYGYEEWLFNYDWLIEGFQYGYLQPIGKFHSTYAKQNISILLYTINDHKERLLVAQIDDVYIPDHEESKNIYFTYKKNGWLKQMRKDILAVNGNPIYINDGTPELFVNIKFKPKNVKFFNPPIKIEKTHPLYITNSRYHPFNWDTSIQINIFDDPLSDIELADSDLKNLPETERDSLVKSRIGQGIFRAELEKYWGSCAVTGCDLTEVLRASHIKPWRLSNNKDRLDVFNGLLLTANIDALFDKGLISFSDTGKILISPKISKVQEQMLGINKNLKLRKIEPQHKIFLSFHRELFKF